jgi:hypothetical protein
MINGPAFVIANLTLTLTCAANGIDSTNNAVTFTWFKDSKTLTQYTGPGPQLTKTALTSDSGLYACSVTHLGATSNVSQPLNLTACEYESVGDHKSGAYTKKFTNILKRVYQHWFVICLNFQVR